MHAPVCVVASTSLGMQVSQAEASASFDKYHSGNFFLTQPSAGASRVHT